MLNLPFSPLACGVIFSNVISDQKNARHTNDKMTDKYYPKSSYLDPISVSLSLSFNSHSPTLTLYLNSRPP